jgi:hypothetical protein
MRSIIVLLFVVAATAVCPAEKLLIPYTEFCDAEAAKKVRSVAEHYTFHREFDNNRFESTTKVFDYLMDRMPLTSTIMRHLELEEYEITVNDDGTMIYDDKHGMIGTFEPVYATSEKRIFYGDGTFDASVLGDIRGQSVVVMDYCQEEPNVIRNKVTVFIRVRGLLGPVCKLASPILNGMVGRKSATLLNASTILSERLAKDPQGVYEDLVDCTAITDDQRRDFAALFLKD